MRLHKNLKILVQRTPPDPPYPPDTPQGAGWAKNGQNAFPLVQYWKWIAKKTFLGGQKNWPTFSLGMYHKSIDIVNLCVKWTCIGGTSGIQISGGEPPPTRRRPEQNIKGFSSIFFFASKALLLQVFSSFVFSELFLLDRPIFFPSPCTSYSFSLSFFLFILRSNYSPSKKSATTWWLFVETKALLSIDCRTPRCMW